jgi:hypothetical protein
MLCAHLLDLEVHNMFEIEFSLAFMSKQSHADRNLYNIMTHRFKTPAFPVPLRVSVCLFLGYFWTGNNFFHSELVCSRNSLLLTVAILSLITNVQILIILLFYKVI